VADEDGGLVEGIDTVEVLPGGNEFGEIESGERRCPRFSASPRMRSVLKVRKRKKGALTVTVLVIAAG